MVPISILTKTTERTGTDILADVNDTLGSLAAEANDRDSVISERLAALEAEQADVRQARRRAEAALTTA